MKCRQDPSVGIEVLAAVVVAVVIAVVVRAATRLVLVLVLVLGRVGVKLKEMPGATLNKR